MAPPIPNTESYRNHAPTVHFARLIPDAQFSRAFTFHVIENPKGERLWIGRHLLDLIEYLRLYHPEGVIVRCDAEVYKITVRPTKETDPHG